MLEAYQAWGDQFTIAAMTRDLIVNAAAALGVESVVTPAGEVQLTGEWQWVQVYPGLSAALGEEITPDTPLHRLRVIADARGIEYEPAWIDQRLVLELFGEIVEPTLVQPTFYDYPAIAQPLARNHRDDPRLVEAWDLIIGGVEGEAPGSPS